MPHDHVSVNDQHVIFFDVVVLQLHTVAYGCDACFANDGCVKAFLHDYAHHIPHMGFGFRSSG